MAPPKPAKTKDAVKKQKFGKSGLNTKRIAEDGEDANESAGVERFWKFPKGKTKIRLITHPDTGLFCYPLQVVYVPAVVDGKEKKLRFVSPKTADRNEYCPATEAAMALQRRGEKDQAREIRPSKRYITPCVVFNNETSEWEPKTLDMPLQVFRDIIGVLSEQLGDSDNPDDVEDHLAHPKNGCTITVHRSENGKRVDYSVVVNQNKRLPVKPEWIQPLDSIESELAPSKVEDIEKAICEYLELDDITDLIGASSKATSSDDDEDEEEEAGNEEDEDEDEEGDELDGLDRSGLKAHIKKHNLDVRVTTKMSDDDIRTAIRATSSEEEEEESDEEEDEDEDEDDYQPKPGKGKKR